LTIKQRRALECLTTRGVDESLGDVAERAGVSISALHRYMRDNTFAKEFKKSIGSELAANRAKMARALIEGGSKPGPSQASMQKLFWTLTGDFKESLEISGPDGGPVEIQASTIPVESLSFHVKRLILFELNGGQVSEQVVEMLMQEVDAKEVNGNGGGQMKVIETTAVIDQDEDE
jgi:AcrR family transcriptional regulator